MAYYSDYGQHLWKCGIAWAEPSTWAKQRCFLWNLFSDDIMAIYYHFSFLFITYSKTTTNPTLTFHRNATIFHDKYPRVRERHRCGKICRFGRDQFNMEPLRGYIFIGLRNKIYCLVYNDTYAYTFTNKTESVGSYADIKSGQD